jgi:hypothetical protein
MNMRMGKEDLTEHEMIHACQLANAHEFIVKLPHVCFRGSFVRFHSFLGLQNPDWVRGRDHALRWPKTSNNKSRDGLIEFVFSVWR